MTKVSVIIPAFNEEKYIKKCIDSILNQTLKDIEIVLVDDGSTDKTYEIMKYYDNNYDNVTAIQMNHGGVGKARNKGISLARGEYIKFVDSDDYIEPNALELMYNKAKENDAGIVRCSYRTIIGPFKLGDFHNYYKRRNGVIDTTKDKNYIVKETAGIGNKLIKRELLKDINFGEGIKWEDLAFVPAILAKSGKVYFMNEALYNYRFNLSTSVLDQFRVIKNIDDIFKSLDKLKKYMPKGYDEQYKSIFTIHLLYRLQEVEHWIFYSKEEKEKLFKKFIDILNDEYDGWYNDSELNECLDNKPAFKKAVKRLKKYYR